MKTDILNIAQWVMEYSILLSIQLLVLLLVRPLIGKWFGAVNSYRLWLLPLVWLPFYFIDWSAVNWQSLPDSLQQGDSTGVVTGGLMVLTLKDLALDLPLPSLPDITVTESARPDLWIWGAALWLSGVLVLLALEAYRIVRFSSYVDFTGTPVPDDEVRLINRDADFVKNPAMIYMRGMDSPALYGLFHSVLLLPENFLARYDAEQRHMILAHEAVHQQRKDNLWNLMACISRTFFWFNPFVHLAHHCYRLDQELSCDALALARCEGGQARRYAQTLLDSVASASPPRHPPIIAAWENPKQLKGRIQMIRQHLRGDDRRGSAIFWILIFTLSGSGLTSCVSKDVSEQVVVEELSRESTARPVARNDQVLSRQNYERIREVMHSRDQNDYAAALNVLDEMKALADAGKLDTRERFVMWQFYANIYQLQENYPKATDAYKQILLLSEIDLEQRRQALFYLATLLYIQEDYQASIDRFMEYNRIADEPNADAYFRIGTAYYMLDQYADAIPYIHRNMELLQKEGKPIPKNTFDLLRSLYLSIEDNDAAMEVLDEAIAEYDDERDKALLEQITASSGETGSGIRDAKVPVIADDPRSILVRAAVKSSDVEMLPIVVVQPDYPPRAAVRGIEGWILVGFTVTESGEVEDPEVIDAEPGNVFDRSALKAIREFRFNPRIVDGKPVEVADVRYLFRYNLSN